jgi:hypothetical protein
MLGTSTAVRSRHGLLAAAIVAGALLLSTSSAAAQDPQPEALLFPAIRVAPGPRVYLGVPVALDASLSTHRVAAALVDEVRYTWDLGDGNVRSGQQVLHDYAAPGTYRVALTMELFETTGIFHRSISETELTVELGTTPELVAVIDLQSGLAQTGKYAALVRIDDRLLLLERGDSETPLQPMESWGARLPIDFERYAVAGGMMALGELRLWTGSLAIELDGDRLLASLGVGLSSGTTIVPLAGWLPAAAQGDHDLNARILRADFVSAGLCLQLAPRMYILGALGILHTEGLFEGSGRVTVEAQRLPSAFEHRTPALCLGLGVRFSWAMLSLQAMVVL